LQFVFLTSESACHFIRTEYKAPDKNKAQTHSKVVGHLYGKKFFSHFWRLQFEAASDFLKIRWRLFWNIRMEILQEIVKAGSGRGLKI